MLVLAALLAPVASAQVTFAGPFAGTMGTETFESLGGQAAVPCLVPGVFGGTTSLCTLNGAGVYISSGWSFQGQCTIFPHAGNQFYGSAAGATELVFRTPVTMFGGYFGTNSGSPSFTVDFYDANGALIDSRIEVYPGQCIWTWFGYQIPGGATRIVVTGTLGGGFVMMDDLEATDSNDADGDGIDGSVDNCPTVANANQRDDDRDGVGNACDNCPLDVNPGQEDVNGNGVGDACDCGFRDDDGDGVRDGCDTCPGVYDPNQTDSDGDGVGELCDDCPDDFDPAQLDTDTDGAADACDNCPVDSNASQRDSDGDGLGDPCDPCPLPGDSIDSDHDGICDGTDRCQGFDDHLDPDGDHRPSGCDDCPLTADPLQADADGDGMGDVCDTCPTAGDPADSDGDGVCDGDDLCIGGNDHQDTDRDGFPDDCDPCPVDPYDDSDGDGACDGDDRCAGVDDFGPDTDADGWPDDCDACPEDWTEQQGDFDGDGFGDACDCRVGDALVFPGAQEICNGIDDDCDGETDDDAADTVTVWRDGDGDGQGDPGASSEVCLPSSDQVTNDTDCDDSAVAIHVGALEVCDGLDNDCDGITDPDCPTEEQPHFETEAGGCGCDQGGAWPSAALLGALAVVGRRRRGGPR